MYVLLVAVLRTASGAIPSDSAIPLDGAGFPLQAQWHQGVTWYRARAATRNADGTYDVHYADGDRWDRTPRDKIRLGAHTAAAVTVAPALATVTTAPSACAAGRFLAEAVGVSAGENSSCLSWRQTGGCRPDGRREAVHDRACSTLIEDGISGFCECAILPAALAIAARAAALSAAEATAARPGSSTPAPPPSVLTAIHGGVGCSHRPLRCATTCPSAGTQMCMDCPAGRYSVTVQGRALPCAPWPPCPAGTERTGASASASGSCRACPYGTFKARPDTDRSGAPWGAMLPALPRCVVWLRCGAGKHQSAREKRNATFGGRCTACPAGRFSNPSMPSPQHVTAGCTLCPSGQHQELSGASSCTSCAAGRYRDSPGGTSANSCARCTPGRFAKLASAIACNACPAGKYRKQKVAALATDHGQQFLSGMSCSACPSGQFQPGSAEAAQTKWKQAQAAAAAAQARLKSARAAAAAGRAASHRLDAKAKAAREHAASLMALVHEERTSGANLKTAATAAAASAAASLSSAKHAESASAAAASLSAAAAAAAAEEAELAAHVTVTALAAAAADAPVRCLPCKRGWHSLRSASQCWPCPSHSLQQQVQTAAASVVADGNRSISSGALYGGRLADVGVEGCASGALGGGAGGAPPALLIMDTEGWGQAPPAPPLSIAVDLYIGVPNHTTSAASVSNQSEGLEQTKWLASARASLGGVGGKSRALAKRPYMISLDKLGQKKDRHRHGRWRRRRRLHEENMNSLEESIGANALMKAWVSPSRESHWTLEAPNADKSLGRGALGRLLAAAMGSRGSSHSGGMASIVPRAFPVELLVLNTEGGAVALAEEMLGEEKRSAHKHSRVRRNKQGRRQARHGRSALERAMRRSSARAAANAETDPMEEQWWRWPEYRGAFALVEDEAAAAKHLLPSTSASTSPPVAFALRVIQPPPPSTNPPLNAYDRGLDGGGERILRTWLTGLPLATGATVAGGTDEAQPAAADAVPKRATLGEVDAVVGMLDEAEGALFAPLPGRCWPWLWGDVHDGLADGEELPPSAARKLDWNAFIEHFLLAELSAAGQPASVRWRPLLFTRRVSDVSNARTGGDDAGKSGSNSNGTLLAIGLPSGLGGGFGILGTRLQHNAADTAPDTVPPSALRLDEWAYQADIRRPARPLADANSEADEGFGSRFEQRNARMAARRVAMSGGGGLREWFTPQLAYWFQRLLAIPQFASKLARRWRQLRRGDGNGGEGPWGDEALRNLVKQAVRWHVPETAQRNFVRWPILGGQGPWENQPSSEAAATQAASALHAMLATNGTAVKPLDSDAGGVFGASFRAVRDTAVARARWMDRQLLGEDVDGDIAKLRALHRANAHAGNIARFRFGGHPALCRYTQAPSKANTLRPGTAKAATSLTASACTRPGLKVRAFDLNPSSYLRTAAAAVAAAKAEAAKRRGVIVAVDKDQIADDAGLDIHAVADAISTASQITQELKQMRTARGASEATAWIAASAAIAAATTAARSGARQSQRLGLTDVLQPLGSRIFTGNLLWNDTAALNTFARKNAAAAAHVGDNHRFPFARGDVRHELSPLLPWAERTKLAKAVPKPAVQSMGGDTAAGAALLAASTWLLSHPNPGGLLWSGGLEGVAEPVTHESSRWRKVQGSTTDRRLTDATAGTSAAATDTAAADLTAAGLCTPYLSAVLAIRSYSTNITSNHGGWGSSTSGVSALAFSENSGATPISETVTRAFDGSTETKFLQFVETVHVPAKAGPLGQKSTAIERLRAKPDPGPAKAGAAEHGWVGLGVRFDAVLDRRIVVSRQVQAVLRRPVHAYTITSADDDPARDPAEWVVEAWLVPLETARGTAPRNQGGSATKGRWVELDRRSSVRFSSRGTTRLFCVSKNGTVPMLDSIFGAFRLRVSALRGDKHTDAFQVAEWALLHCGGAEGRDGAIGGETMGVGVPAVCHVVQEHGVATFKRPSMSPLLAIVPVPGQDVAAVVARTKNTTAEAAARSKLRENLQARCAAVGGGGKSRAQLASWKTLRFVAESAAGSEQYQPAKLGEGVTQQQQQEQQQLQSVARWLGLHLGPPLGGLLLNGTASALQLLPNRTNHSSASNGSSSETAQWGAICIRTYAVQEVRSLVRAAPKQLQLPTAADELAWRHHQELRHQERSAAAAAVGFPMRLLALSLSPKTGANPTLRFDGLLTLPPVTVTSGQKARWRLRVEAIDRVWVWLDGILLIDTGGWPTVATEAKAEKEALSRLRAAKAEARAEAQAQSYFEGKERGDGAADTQAPSLLSQRVWQAGQGVHAAMQISWNWIPSGDDASSLTCRLRIEVLMDRGARKRVRPAAGQHWLGLGLMWQRANHEEDGTARQQQPWEVIPASALTHWPDPDLPSGAAVDCPPPVVTTSTLPGAGTSPHCTAPRLTWQVRRVAKSIAAPAVEHANASSLPSAPVPAATSTFDANAAAGSHGAGGGAPAVEDKAVSAATSEGAKSVASILIVCLLVMVVRSATGAGEGPTVLTVRSATGAGESATALAYAQQKPAALSTQCSSVSAVVEMIEVLEHVEAGGRTFGSVERDEDGTQREADDESLLLVN